MTSPRTIAIGDIHGCALALATLLESIDPDPDDTIVTLGDYIDRGPDSRGVMELMLELQSQCQLVPLLGNHELMLLTTLQDPAQLKFWVFCGGQETIDSYGGVTKIPDEHIAFMRQCRPHYETVSQMFLHANYDSQLPLEEQPAELTLWRHLTEGSTPGPHQSGKTAVVGHTPQANCQILDRGYLICIDTYCYGNGCLTAIDVDTRRLWQADKQGRRL